MPHNITFPAGSINNTFNITIQDDDISEMNETFNVTLLTIPSSRPINIANGTTTVVIVDNDRKFYKDEFHNISSYMLMNSYIDFCQTFMGQIPPMVSLCRDDPNHVFDPNLFKSLCHKYYNNISFYQATAIAIVAITDMQRSNQN